MYNIRAYMGMSTICGIGIGVIQVASKGCGVLSIHYSEGKWVCFFRQKVERYTPFRHGLSLRLSTQPAVCKKNSCFGCYYIFYSSSRIIAKSSLIKCTVA